MDRGIHFIAQGNRRPVQRLLALALCALFIAGPLLSETFIFTHIDHEHDHYGSNECCAICIHLSAAEGLLRILSVILAGAAFLYGCFSVLCAILSHAELYAGFVTLVHLKVRMNN